MLTFLARRTLLLIPILFGVSIITFLMIHLVPGDPVQIMLGHAPSGTDVAALRHQLGLDQALPVQYGNYLVNALHGNLGTSIRSGRPVVAEIGDRFPATLQLTLTAMVIAVILGVGIGTLAATSRRRFVDNILMLLATMGVSLPT